MKIISAPHPTLRTVASEVTKVDKKLRQFVNELEETLRLKDNPKGVGLAAPQVDKKLRIFSTQFALDEQYDSPAALKLDYYINPTITKHSGKQTFGQDKKNPQLEGCLSIPHLYGPVPRWEWVELNYFVINNDELEEKNKKFLDFEARVIQHELDHLNGILFTDYILEYDLPFYVENKKKR